MSKNITIIDESNTSSISKKELPEFCQDYENITIKSLSSNNEDGILISELINQLEEVKSSYGDLPIVTYRHQKDLVSFGKVRGHDIDIISKYFFIYNSPSGMKLELKNKKALAIWV